MHWIKGLRWWLLLLVLVIATGFGYRYWSQNNAVPQYKTVKLEKGPITASVAASGTLNPVVSVLVGSQVSGQLKEILVDFNSEVTQGQLLARIDPQTFEYKVRQAQADLDAARAQVQTQQANLAAQRSEVTRNEVALADAQLTLDRKQQLVDKGFISTAERDTARTALHAADAQIATARAQVVAANANLTSAQATVRQRSAVLEQARIDLGRTAIKAPVAGVVIKRSVDKGQTVAASLQSPELFIIAGDLTDMRVDTAIDESEIGRIRKGQKASFTVDAFPGRTFEGEVLEIRKAAQNVSNVITYMVEVSASNPKKELLPGMTANVKIVTDSRDNILKVPNAALRFKPAGAVTGTTLPAKAPTSAGSAPVGQQRGGARGHQARSTGRLYTLDANGQPLELTVRQGLTDGSVTEVSGPNLKEGTEIITGLAPSSTAAGRTSGAARSGPRMF
ncbi:MAG: efflux RND transporter periplasmic adaptor subunit [Herbaspirillum sp.]